MRRTTPEPREILPDPRYNSTIVTTLIHHIMKRGKMSLATSLVYDALEMAQQKTGKASMEVLEQALKNVGPMMEVRPRRVGGATYQVPLEVPSDRRLALGMRWIITAARARTGKSFSEKLAAELMDALNNQGAAVRKREETHKMAEANRAFSHYRV
ncbi:MAG: 30S ribosomal protein S7 [Anaerolineaceae bacterium]|nr:30S ribosomal protein S7 [Anaerolineaceae bacterium]